MRLDGSSISSKHGRINYPPQRIIDAYAVFVRVRVSEGWEPTFLSFMFNPLQVGDHGRGEAMRLEVERIYGWLLTRHCRRPTTTPNHRKPALVACPDWPVPKLGKVSLSDVVVNDGLHLHAFYLSPPASRLDGTLSAIISKHRSKLVGPSMPLARIYAEPFKKAPEEVVAYILKSLSRGRATLDDLIVLPRANGEPFYRGPF